MIYLLPLMSENFKTNEFKNYKLGQILYNLSDVTSILCPVQGK